jgi:hypothetical protein
MLPNGKVIVVGGYNSTNYVSVSEVYDPATGVWTNTGPLFTLRVEPSLTALPNGKMLIAGGWVNSGVYNYQNSAELYDAGLGFSGASQPVIAAIPSPFVISNALQITGSKFRGVSEASDSASQSSPTDFPILQLRNFENEQTVFLTPTNWSTNVFASVPVTNFPLGYAFATVFANGISSTSSVVQLAATVPVGLKPSVLGDGRVKLSFAGMFGPGVSYSVLATTNIGTPLTNWVQAGAATDSLATPGQFQFTDPQSTNLPNRFYRVQWP